jgi:uncharacterized protein (DUF2141 family)
MNLLNLTYRVLFAIGAVSIFIMSFKYKAPSGKCNLKVIISKMQSDKGQVAICLFNKADGFPSGKALECQLAKAKTNYTEYTFTNLETGTYAVSLFHDANDNKKLDKNWLGIPKEGIGASNNARGTFGPPKFDDAKFILDKPDQAITISLFYY